jgi:hypothetical protein
LGILECPVSQTAMQTSEKGSPYGKEK